MVNRAVREEDYGAQYQAIHTLLIYPGSHFAPPNQFTPSHYLVKLHGNTHLSF